MSTVKTLLLNSGHSIPILGLGVYQTPPSVAKSIVYDALKVGYRHIDSAAGYRNEADVCAGIMKWVNEDPANNKRADVFYTTKIWDVDQGYEKAQAWVKEAVKKAKDIDYIDLVLIHSPRTDYETRRGTWMALQEGVESGKIKSIGVSNFGVPHIEEMTTYPGLKIMPAINQIEIHPWCMRPEIYEACAKHGIVMEAYSPLTRAKKLDEPILVEICKKYGKTPAQVLIKWSLQSGFVALPKTVNPERLVENFDVFDWELKKEDFEKLNTGERQCLEWDPVSYDG